MFIPACKSFVVILSEHSSQIRTAMRKGAITLIQQYSCQIKEPFMNTFSLNSAKRKSFRSLQCKNFPLTFCHDTV